MAEKRWISETLFDDLGFCTSYAAERVLHESRSAHQHVILFEQKHFGKMLMLDGATQVTTRDEFIYHEMMSHVPILAHGRARDVLIVGGGDCGIAEEVLKHKSVRRLTQVEIDEEVIAFAREHFPEFTQPVFSDSRFKSIIGDGMEFVAATAQRFDVVIVDSTDPQGPGAVLFTTEFYAGCKRCMKPGGVLVTQNGVPFFQPDELRASIGKFRAWFADASCYIAAIPTYAGGHLAMGWATDNARVRQTGIHTLAARYDRAGRFPTKYWTPEVHRASFALPRFIADIAGSSAAG